MLRADDAAVRAIEEAVRTAASSNWVALGLAEYALGVALLSRDAAADRRRGLELVVQFRDLVRERAPFLVPVAELVVARERAGRGDRDAAIAVMRQAVDELHRAGRPFFGVWGTGVLVETLLERGAEGDLAEAQEAIDWLANLLADEGSAMLDITLLRLRALLARAHGDEERLPRLAGSLPRDGDIAWLRRTHRDGRGDVRPASSCAIRGAITATGSPCKWIYVALVCRAACNLMCRIPLLERPLPRPSSPCIRKGKPLCTKG